MRINSREGHMFQGATVKLCYAQLSTREPDWIKPGLPSVSAVALSNGAAIPVRVEPAAALPWRHIPL